MSIETLHNNDYVAFTDRDGNTCYRSAEEQAEIDRNAELKMFLEHSSLSDGDLQHLRAISAEYAVVTTPIPESEKDERREVLDYLLSDLPRVKEEDFMGLRKSNKITDAATVTIDGCPISVEDLSQVYMAIEPSTEVLDRAVEEATLDHVATVISEQPSAIQLAEAAAKARHDLEQTRREISQLAASSTKYLGDRALSAVGARH